jgi:DNA-binding MarR family transcriptional regulator
MTEPAALSPGTASAALAHDPGVIARLDRALLRMRHTVVRPEITSVPIPALQRTVDLAKVMACLVIADLQGLEDPTRPVTVKDVAAALELEHSTASRLLSETEAEGLIVRSTDPTDRRRTVAALTSTGQAVVEQSSTIRAWAIDTMLSEWSATDLAAFTELVEKFSATIEARSETVLRAAVQRFHDAPASGR